VHWCVFVVLESSFTNIGLLLFLGPLVDLPLGTVQSAFETNVFSVLRVTHAVVPHMAKRKSGLVINMGSIAALTYVRFWHKFYVTRS
jgi:NADP-dependent 3-hydroxy acid dehydrogenase YdfG